MKFDISVNALEIRAVQSPKCIAWCAVDCTYILTFNVNKVISDTNLNFVHLIVLLTYIIFLVSYFHNYTYLIISDTFFIFLLFLLCSTSDPPRLRTGVMLILKCFSTIARSNKQTLQLYNISIDNEILYKLNITAQLLFMTRIKLKIIYT
jgi:hypothetical protein